MHLRSLQIRRGEHVGRWNVAGAQPNGRRRVVELEVRANRTVSTILTSVWVAAVVASTAVGSITKILTVLSLTEACHS